MAYSGGPPEIQGNFTIAASGTDSNKINGNGYGIAGFYVPASIPGGTLNVKLGLDAITAPTCVTPYDEDGTSLGALTLNTAGSSAANVACYVSLDPKRFHTVHWVQVTINSAAGSSAITISPVWY